MDPRTRLREVESLLIAYNDGWFEYDKYHVRQLQAERVQLLDAIAKLEQEESQ